MQNHTNLLKANLTRRQFLRSSAAGAAAIYMAPALTLGADQKSRVISVKHAGLINADERVNAEIARECVDQALLALTQKKDMKDAWRQVFPNLQPADTIGLKVNSVNRKCPTHPEIAYAIAQSLMDSLDVAPNQIIIWDRANSELVRTGYAINYSDKGIRCFGTVKKFSVTRWLMGRKLDEKGGIGYDKSAAIDVGNGLTSNLSKILTQMCTYLINVPVLKDHGRAGVTMSLKNHYGTIDNPKELHSEYCDPYTAMINASDQIKGKTKLIICDAAYGVYKGGPLGAPQWQHKSILAAFDPVAIDYTGLQIINAKRKENNEDDVTPLAVHLKTAEALGLGTCNPDKIVLNKIKLA
ncbi:MAG: DUF362 domain-containing protein [Desulfobacteraceae bacterium]|nr:DUF362 domain-containing protein [Desulfobacteraceae bacterium]